MANIFQSNYYFGINSLHSFRSYFKSYSDNECLEFEKKFSFVDNKIMYYDKDYVNDFVEIIKQLYKTNDIQIKSRVTAICECGRAEITQSELTRFDQDNIEMQLIEHRNGEWRCRFCKKKLVFDNRENLYLCFKEDELKKNIRAYPSYLNSDFNHFRKSLNNSYLRISRLHNTGISLVLDDKQFYLDIDMLWKFIPFFLNKQNVVVVASVKHTFSLFIINYLSQIINRNNVYFIGLPFIEIDSIKYETMNFLNDSQHRTSLKLLVLLGIGWSKKSIVLSDSTCKYFMSSRDKNTQLYNFLSSVKFDTTNWHEICEIITLYTKLQTVLQLKKSRKK